MRIPKHILLLIEKYQSGTATPEEKQQLDQWYQSFEPSHATVHSTDYTDDQQQLSDAIKSRLLKTIAQETAPVVAIPARKRWYTAAAAVLLFLVTGSAYLVFISQPAKKQSGINIHSAATSTNDLAPGTNKAILTLADGSTIVLDSVSDGTISQQGNIQVKKLGSGLLAYTINGKEITENDEAFYNTITTPRGGQYHVTLSDGTRVWLNAASSIRFPVVFTGEKRQVQITGEAYFEVTTLVQDYGNKTPFVVKVNNKVGKKSEIEVLGTHFNVNAYDDEALVKTTLLEGKVKVSVPGNTASDASAILLPGQQSGISGNGNIRVVDDADTEEAVAWKNGRFQFKSADLQSILRQISRWYDVDIKYQDNVNLHFTGQLTRNDNASRVFEKLEMTGEVHFKVEGKTIIVSP